jgi:hypothetical protein
MTQSFLLSCHLSDISVSNRQKKATGAGGWHWVPKVERLLWRTEIQTFFNRNALQHSKIHHQLHFMPKVAGSIRHKPQPLKHKPTGLSANNTPPGIHRHWFSTMPAFTQNQNCTGRHHAQKK